LIFLRQELLLYRLVRTNRETRLRKMAQQMAVEHIRNTVIDPSIWKKLIPDYAMGCKRILLSDNYYQTLNRKHVQLCTDAIERIAPQGIHTADGTLHGVDVIVYATGFDIDGWFDRLDVTSPEGISLQELWQDLPTAYQGACIPGFPNLWLVTGPNSGLGHNSVVYMIEAQMELIMQGIARAGRDYLISVSEQANRDFNRRIQADLANTVWAGSCDSWYKRPSGEIVTLYPYTSATFSREHQHLQEADFELQPVARDKAAVLT
jgi:cation diffusion facilitator CzcD-associated flavoprotein CzcO